MEVHRLTQVDDDLEEKSEIFMKLEFQDEEEQENWATTINIEIDKLKSVAFNLCYQ